MNPDVIHKLEAAYALHMQGAHAKAETGYLDVLNNDKNNVHALNLLGMLYVNSDRPDQAKRYLEMAVAAEPNDAQAQNNLGLALKGTGAFIPAAEAFSRAIKLEPGNPTYRNNLGSVHSDRFQWDAAIPCFVEALKIFPDYPECLGNLSHAFNQVNRSMDAIAAARRAIALQPDFAKAYYYLADALMKHCAYDEATTHYDKAYELDTDFLDALINKSIAQKDAGHLSASEEALQQTMTKAPDYARSHYVYGLLMEQLGHSEKAKTAYEKAVRLNPEYGAAYYQLSQLKGYGIRPADEAKIQGWLNDPDCSPEQKKHAAFTLARIFEGRKSFPKSLEYYQAGHEAILGNAQYDNAKTGAWYADIDAVFSGRQKPLKHVGSDGPYPLFVVGMPRSGTSLTEQILTSHSQISGGGESSFLEDTISEARCMTGQSFPRCMQFLTVAQKQGLGKLYKSRLIAKNCSSRLVMDKTPYNFQYLGFINAILPEAKLIHCQRNPMDNCLSIYRHPFDRAQSYAHRLDTLGQFYIQYKKLMQIWHRVLGENVLDVTYENVVDDLEGEARRMLDFLDLPFEDAVLNYHKSKAIVRTPSAGQVRQPIYKDKVQYWQRYGNGLSPLQVALDNKT